MIGCLYKQTKELEEELKNTENTVASLNGGILELKKLLEEEKE